MHISISIYTDIYRYIYIYPYIHTYINNIYNIYIHRVCTRMHTMYAHLRDDKEGGGALLRIVRHTNGGEGRKDIGIRAQFDSRPARPRPPLQDRDCVLVLGLPAPLDSPAQLGGAILRPRRPHIHGGGRGRGRGGRRRRWRRGWRRRCRCRCRGGGGDFVGHSGQLTGLAAGVFLVHFGHPSTPRREPSAGRLELRHERMREVARVLHLFFARLGHLRTHRGAGTHARSRGTPTAAPQRAGGAGAASALLDPTVAGACCASNTRRAHLISVRPHRRACASVPVPQNLRCMLARKLRTGHCVDGRRVSKRQPKGRERAQHPGQRPADSHHTADHPHTRAKKRLLCRGRARFPSRHRCEGC